MTLQQLRYFLEVTRTLHYTEASENLHVSQPSLSYSIKNLEEELGVDLFRKEGKQVYITEYGTTLKVYAERIFNILDEANDHIEYMKHPNKGQIKLGYVYSCGTELVPNLIYNFNLDESNKDISFNLKMGNTPDLLHGIKKNIIDIALLPLNNPNIEGIETYEILKQDLYLLVHKGHSFYNRESVSIKDLEAESLILLNENTDLHKQTMNILKEYNVTPKVANKVEELNIMAAFIAEGMGLGIGPKIPTYGSYELKLIPFEEGFTRKICLTYSSNVDYPPSIENFISFIKATDFTIH